MNHNQLVDEDIPEEPKVEGDLENADMSEEKARNYKFS